MMLEGIDCFDAYDASAPAESAFFALMLRRLTRDLHLSGCLLREQEYGSKHAALVADLEARASLPPSLETRDHLPPTTSGDPHAAPDFHPEQSDARQAADS